MIDKTQVSATAMQAAHHRHHSSKPQAYANLAVALKSGNVDAAKQAFKGLQVGPPQGVPTSSLDALSKALNAGDIDAAKKIFAQLPKPTATSVMHRGVGPLPPVSGGTPTAAAKLPTTHSGPDRDIEPLPPISVDGNLSITA